MLSLSQSFPKPTILSSSVFKIPLVWPGCSPESTIALTEVLKDNHRRFHIFFNDVKFHNHLAHHALALWSLGATGAQIRAASEKDSEIQQPIYESPEQITESNFAAHVGDGKFFKAYTDFFSKRISSIGVEETIERWVFSSKANYDEDHGRPQMFDRFISFLYHAMIHVGYGIEYGIPGMVVEGLAMAATHPAEVKHMIPDSLFDSDDLAAAFVSKASIQDAPVANVHALSIIARLLTEKSLALKPEEQPYDGPTLLKNMEANGPVILRCLEDWTKFDASDPLVVNKKLTEVYWAVTLMYVSGWKDGELLHNDFFLMHLVTSSLFLPSFLTKLSPKHQWILLTRHFAIALSWWVARGRNFIDIKAFFSADIVVGAGSADWFSIIGKTFEHSDEHLPKLQRALAHFASVYGGISAGDEQFAGVELEGAHLIDGSLFTRAASLTITSLVEGKDARKAKGNLDSDDGEAVLYWDFF